MVLKTYVEQMYVSTSCTLSVFIFLYISFKIFSRGLSRTGRDLLWGC